MQRLSVLSEDALTRARLSLVPHQTQLQLLGFLISGDRQNAGPVEILAQSEGQRYLIAYDGSAHQLVHQPRDEVRMPDIPAAGGTVCVGYCAYHLGGGKVVVGPQWQVRRQLRAAMKAMGPTQALAAQQYINNQALAVLQMRAFVNRPNPAQAEVNPPPARAVKAPALLP